MSNEVKFEKALLKCAAHCQGGHSDAGQNAADALEIPFPITMPNLVKAAKERGYNTDTLWPWLKAQS